MYSNTSRNDVIDTFVAIGRADIGDGNGGDFTIDALHALFDYMEEFEESIGEQVEFDPIGLCCQFSEYASAMDALHELQPDIKKQIEGDLRDQFSNGTYSYMKDVFTEILEKACFEWLHDQTIVVEFDSGIIIDSEF